MKRSALLLMGKSFIPERHMAEFDLHGQGNNCCLYTVRDKQEARDKVLELKENGFGVIELCGAFGRDFALELIELTNGEVGIGYVVYEPEQHGLVERFFGNE